MTGLGISRQEAGGGGVAGVGISIRHRLRAGRALPPRLTSETRDTWVPWAPHKHKA